jgi:translocation protein SEC66
MPSISASTSAIAPIAYLVLVLGSLALFSTIYRRRKAQQSQNLKPWFPTHHTRDVYLTLLHMDPSPPPNILKAALLERAKEDITRIYQLREQKTAANQLLQKGSIAETTFQQIVAAEADLNVEIQDVMNEARALGGDEWGGNILPQANEYYQKTMILKTIEKSSELARREKERWEEEKTFRKAEQDRRREEALKELTEEKRSSPLGKVNGQISQVEGEIPNGNTDTPGKSKKKKNKK